MNHMNLTTEPKLNLDSSVSPRHKARAEVRILQEEIRLELNLNQRRRAAHALGSKPTFPQKKDETGTGKKKR